MTYDIVGQHTMLAKPTIIKYDVYLDIVGHTYNVVTYDVKQYCRYDVAYVFVGVTYDVVVTDLRHRR